MERAKNELSSHEAKLKIASYCAYQERCQQEVRSKLYTYGLTPIEVEEMISYLITENYLNELRFSKAYAGGKFRVKKWGRNKIKSELKRRNLSDHCIQKGLDEIDENEYLTTLENIIHSRIKKYPDSKAFEKRTKIASYLITKGYEPDVVWDLLTHIIKPDK